MSTEEVYIFCVMPFLAVSLVVSLLTAIVRYVAGSVSFVEEGEPDRYHDRPRPLGGGIAMFLGIGLVVAGGLIVVFQFMPLIGGVFQEVIEPHVEGIRSRLVLLGYLFGGAAIVFATGFVDDLTGLSPLSKLGGVTVAALLVFAGGIRFELFLEPGGVVNELIRGVVTVGWIVVLTNAMNLLDNMDGQCAGISLLIGFGLGAIGVQTGQLFVGTMSFVVSGAALGFLVYNAPPAGIFPGDSGSLTLGFFLSTTAVLTTFLQEQYPIQVYLAPLILFAVPLYDTASVFWLRFRAGQPLLEPDVRHFSHRLVDGGHSERFALLVTMLTTLLMCLFAQTLYQTDTLGAVLIGVGTLTLIGVIGLLEEPVE